MAKLKDINLQEQRIIFFDGLCNLCNASVDFVVSHDANRLFRFASLQSELGEEVLKKHKLSAQAYDSFILLEKGTLYIKSSAALRVARHLGLPISLLWIFIIVPPFIRNAVYSWVAQNRYKWFGKKETCRLPTPEERALFLDA